MFFHFVIKSTPRKTIQCNTNNNSSETKIILPENYTLYRNIRKSYEENIKTADFDTLIDEVDRHMSASLYSAIKDADSYKQSLYKTKIVIPALSKTIERILSNVTHVSDDAIWRKTFFHRELEQDDWRLGHGAIESALVFDAANSQSIDTKYDEFYSSYYERSGPNYYVHTNIRYNVLGGVD